MRRRMGLVFVSLLLFVLLLGACGQTTPAATPTASEPTATLPPTDTPMPTATPLPLPPPRLLYHKPELGEVQPLDAPIELIFDQPMDRDSVKAALVLSPTVDGSLVWADDRTVSFVPSPSQAGFERGQRYHVVVDDTARNAEGLSMEEQMGFQFSTAGYLSVSEVMPAPDSDELFPDTVVTVIFDRPVVPLTAINKQADLPDPLTFVPPVRGEGEWLNTSIYLFRPEEGFLPSTRYKARVAAGLADTTGGILAEDYAWEFTTYRPSVYEVRPSNNFQYVGPTDVISVTFNQPMDHASVQDQFSLKVDDQPVEGSFHWSGGDTAVAQETMVFVPTDPLPRDMAFEARVSAAAKPREGGLGMEKAMTWQFSTVKEPGLVGSSPRDGEEDVDPGKSLKLIFASPMQRDGFLDHLTIRPQVTNVYTYWSEYDTEVSIYFPKDPVSAYRVSLDADTPDKYGATLGQEFSVRFDTGDLSSFATLNTGGRLGTFSTYTDTVVYATHRNVSSLEVSLYRVGLTAFTRLNSSWSAWNDFEPDPKDLVKRWGLTGDVARNEVHLLRLELTDDDGDSLPPGLYYLSMSAPEIEARLDEYQPSRYLFVKSGLNVTLKQTQDEMLVWATDLVSGQPVPGLPVTLYSESNELDATGTTGRDGVLLAEDLTVENVWRSFFAFTGQPGDDDFGVAYNGWDEGINPWSFDVGSEFWASEYQGYLYTDRPIYRPGQTVYFKGIVRGDDDAVYHLPEEIRDLEVSIDDPQGKQVYQETLSLSDMGTLFDELLLDEQAPLGTYYIEIRDPALDLFIGTSFRVAEYKKPEFQVSVNTDLPPGGAYLNGESINAAAEATYYFGGPVANSDVQWSVLSSGYSFRYECPLGASCPWYSWSDFEWGSYEDGDYYGGYGRLISEGQAQTDDQGRVVFEVAADISQESTSQLFTIEASVTDVNGQQVSNRTATVVHKARFYVGVAPRGYLAQVGEEKEVDLLTADWDSEPVAGEPLTVVFMKHDWYSVRRQAEDGNYYWDWTAVDTPVLTTTATTGPDGKAQVAFSPTQAGSYRVRAIGQDERGNEVRASAYFWVWGGSEFVRWRRESNNRIELIIDKDEYQVGDVAEILIPSPYSGTVQALITIERGHIMETEVRELQGNSEVLRLPITDDLVPNAFVSVVIVQGADQAPDGLSTFKMGLVKVPVSVDSRELSIALTPDKDMEEGEHYGPRQMATYDVLVTDSEGEPVEAELSLRLADLAVLALADEPGPTLMERFWRDRGLGVRTSASLVVAMEPFNREFEPGAKGGGGGDEGGPVRTRFADTAFWDPVVRTGKDGKAQVTVQLPDNLTTWRMQARGITASTNVGRAEVDILTTLDLLVRPVLPRFFVVGDEAEIATIVHNNTGESLEAQVNIAVEGLELEGSTSQDVRVAAGDNAKVTWPVRALAGDAVKVRMWASAGDLYDGREDTMPVYRYSTPEVVATAGQLPEPELRQEIIQLPSTFDPTQGGLTLQIDGSLTAASRDALDYLQHYPYECVEQTVSRFLPNVVTWQALDEMDLGRPELRQELAQLVGAALQRLYNQQHYDGGWGWWMSDDSNAYLTAYALQGMFEAHRAGFVVDEDVMARAADYVRENMPSVDKADTQGEANRLAYQLYVLADYGTLSAGDETGKEGTRELGLAIRLFEKRHLLSQYAQATLAVALGLLEPDEPQRVQTLLSDLVGDALVSATGTHWVEDKPDYWNMNTDIRTTAIVIWAMSRLEPDSNLLPNAIRWLMAVRKDGYWESTQTTAWSLLGLVEYMRASGELQGDFSYSVYLNGEELASGDVTKETIDESQKLQVEIARLLVEEGNRLVIERHPPQAGQTGDGQLYYTAHLEYYLPADHVQALDRGIILARQYSPVDDGTATGSELQYVDSAVVGDVIQVKLTIIAPTSLYYVVVEDPLPAGFEGVDLSLKTTSVVGEQPSLQNVTAGDVYQRYGWGWWWFSHSEMRDEKVALFAQYLPRGTYEYTYLMRASVPGEFHIMPSTAYQMYFPEVFGRSDGGKFTVEPSD